MLCSASSTAELQIPELRKLLELRLEGFQADLASLSARVSSLESAGVVAGMPRAPMEPAPAAPPPGVIVPRNRLPLPPSELTPRPEALEAEGHAPAGAEPCGVGLEEGAQGGQKNMQFPVDRLDGVTVEEGTEGTQGQNNKQSVFDKLDLKPEVYAFQPSMWDVQFFVGKFLTPADSFMVIIFAVLNFLVQVFFVVVVWEMTTATLTDQTVEDYVHWRFSEGHRLSNYDYLTNTSLARRVCDNYGANNVAANQQTQTANFYAYSPPGAFFQTGTWLCVMSVLIWCVTLLIDLWNTECFAVALLSLVKAYNGATIIEDTDEDKIRVVSISLRRCVYALIMIVFPRVAIDIWLLFGGIRFLVYEFSLSGLILNAVALGFILGLDELIFQLLPNRAQSIIDLVEPVPKNPRFLPKRKHLDKRSLLIILGCTGVVLHSWFRYIGPLAAYIHEGQRILCGRNTDFIYAVDPVTGAVTTAPTSPTVGMTDMHSLLAVLQHSDLELKGHLGEYAGMLPTESLSSRAELRELYETELRTLGLSKQEMPCRDQDDTVASARALHSSYFGGFGTEALAGSFCSRAAHWCAMPPHRKTIRLVCAETCKCSSAFLYDRQDCGDQCSSLVRNMVATAASSCNDTSDRVGDVQGLRHFMRSLSEYLLRSGKLESLQNRTRLSPAWRDNLMRQTNYAYLMLDFPVFRNVWNVSRWLLAGEGASIEPCQLVPFINEIFDLDVCQESASFGTIRGFCPLSCHASGCSSSLPPPKLDFARLASLQSTLSFRREDRLFVPRLRCGMPRKVPLDDAFFLERPAWGNGTYTIDWCNSSRQMTGGFYSLSHVRIPESPSHVAYPPECNVTGQLGSDETREMGFLLGADSSPLDGSEAEVTLTCHTDGEISCGRTVSGSTVGALNWRGGSANERIYNIRAPSGMVVSFDARGGELDSRLSVYSYPEGANGMLVGSEDAAGGRGDRSSLTMEMPHSPDQQMLMVEGSALTEGNFTVHMACSYPSISCGDVVMGSTEGLGSIYGSGSPEVIWKFSTGSGGEFTFDTCNSTFDSDLRLLHLNMTLLAYQDFWNISLCGWRSRMTVTLPASAEYHILLNGYGREYGNYTLQVLCNM
mmetsp:Transcript_103276/g.301297  ORF Transcript_103276/g.301297 Transcript_103276/m.301297 type:complete len:1109 (+) Transcript_103276:88-3414(+)